MFIAFLFAAAAAASPTPTAPSPSVPPDSELSQQTPSAIKDHADLRQALAEPMPRSATMVMLYGVGGHLATSQYSIILARGAQGVWHGTAVGRSRIWVDNAPFKPMGRREWNLDKAAGRALDRAIAYRCPLVPKPPADPRTSGPPPLGYMAERVDVIRPKHAPLTFYSDQGGGALAALIRPPE